MNSFKFFIYYKAKYFNFHKPSININFFIVIFIKYLKIIYIFNFINKINGLI